MPPHVVGRAVTGVLRRRDLRWPFAPELRALLPGQRIDAVRRRAKYLLLDTDAGSALLHLGMSGSLRVLPGGAGARARPRRPRAGLGPGAALQRPAPLRLPAVAAARQTHPLLRGLGPEPLSDDFDGDWLFARSRGRSAPVKAFLMDQRIVVGVGNIYAAEALFAAGISPLRRRGRVSRERYRRLAAAVKAILALRDRARRHHPARLPRPDGAPGYFEQELSAYGRGGAPCPRCGRALRQALVGQRATVWCGRCQR
jgi:formamidopyrimidine-DNA glycosylase